MEERHRITIGAIALALAVAQIGAPMVFASEKADIETIREQIDERKAEIERIDGKLEQYRSKIQEYSRRSASLSNDIALIENELAMAELDIVATQNEIDAENLELKILDQRIEETTKEISKEQQILSSLLFELHKQDGKGIIDVLLGANTFNDVFAAAAQLESLNERMRTSLETTKGMKEDMLDQQSEHEERVVELASLEDELQDNVAELDAKRGAKEFLMAETRESEAEYRVLMSELRQEQQFVTSQIAALQDEYQDKLDRSDTSGGSSVITWPITGRITVLFHDPTYPFRNLFEHSGLDIAVPQGTPLKAAAPGYVAWARTGRMYGNYVMIIHGNGLATLYAHMSRLDVVADQYVARGDIIGLSGGRPGTQGAGFSTGPHLHFEVRKDGLPVDPMQYLPELD